MSSQPINGRDRSRGKRKRECNETTTRTIGSVAVSMRRAERNFNEALIVVPLVFMANCARVCFVQPLNVRVVLLRKKSGWIEQMVPGEIPMDSVNSASGTRLSSSRVERGNNGKFV